MLLSPSLEKGDIGGFALRCFGIISQPPLQRGKYYLRINTKPVFILLDHFPGNIFQMLRDQGFSLSHITTLP